MMPVVCPPPEVEVVGPAPSLEAGLGAKLVWLTERSVYADQLEERFKIQTVCYDLELAEAHRQADAWKADAAFWKKEAKAIPLGAVVGGAGLGFAAALVLVVVVR